MSSRLAELAPLPPIAADRAKSSLLLSQEQEFHFLLSLHDIELDATPSTKLSVAESGNTTVQGPPHPDELDDTELLKYYASDFGTDDDSSTSNNTTLSKVPLTQKGLVDTDHKVEEKKILAPFSPRERSRSQPSTPLSSSVPINSQLGTANPSSSVPPSLNRPRSLSPSRRSSALQFLSRNSAADLDSIVSASVDPSDPTEKKYSVVTSSPSGSSPSISASTPDVSVLTPSPKPLILNSPPSLCSSVSPSGSAVAPTSSSLPPLPLLAVPTNTLPSSPSSLSSSAAASTISHLKLEIVELRSKLTQLKKSKKHQDQQEQEDLKQLREALQRCQERLAEIPQLSSQVRTLSETNSGQREQLDELRAVLTAHERDKADLYQQLEMMSLKLTAQDDQSQKQKIERDKLQEQLSKQTELIRRYVDSQWSDLTLEKLVELESHFTESARSIAFQIRKRLQTEKESLLEAKRCLICEDRLINTILLPCGHHVLCSQCAGKVQSCPIDRGVIEKRVETFGR